MNHGRNGEVLPGRKREAHDPPDP